MKKRVNISNKRQASKQKNTRYITLKEWPVTKMHITFTWIHVTWPNNVETHTTHKLSFIMACPAPTL